MIVTITKGRSLGGLGMYLLHDKREGEAGPHPETAERVTWTHTLNLSEDDPREALQEMIATAQAQPMLRRMAGQAKAGRPTKDSAYHVALSWEPSERPDKAHMIEAAQSFLRHMGHHEFQCLMVAHAPDASERLHLHLEVSRIHPLTGATMSNPKGDYGRAQAWAKAYQDERGQTFCAERTKRAEGQPYRNLHMPRWQWEQWKKTDLTREAFLDQVHGELQGQAAARDLRGQQWDGLKARQRAEREQFFRDTKTGAKGLRPEVWLAVKAEFAPRWQAYARKREQIDAESRAYSRALTVKLRQAGYRDWAGQLRRAERQHAAELKAELAAMRGGIQADQSARFAQVNERAWQNYQQGRQEAYRELLTQQQAERHQLHAEARANAPPSAITSLAQLAMTRAKAIMQAMRAPPDLAPAVKPPSNATPRPVAAPQAEAGRVADAVKTAPPVPPIQGRKPMLDEDNKRKKVTAKTEAFIFTPPPPAPPRTTKSTPEAAADHARETRAYEQEKRSAEATHAQQFGAGPNYVDPNATAKAEHAKWTTDRRDEQRAREAASQPHKPLTSTENRPENWKGGTPQYGFGFAPGSPPDSYGNASPNIREHAAPQMPRAPLNAPLQGDRVRLDEAIKEQAAQRRAEATAQKARLADRNRFDSARRTITDPGPETGGAGSPGNRLRSQERGAGDEVTGTTRQPDPRRTNERTRYSAGKEVTDRMAAQAGRAGENTDRKQAMSDREAKLAALNAGASVRAAREREGGRDR